MSRAVVDPVVARGWDWMLPAFTGMGLAAGVDALTRADRLLAPVVLVAVAVACVLAAGEAFVLGDDVTSAEGVLLYGFGVLAGLVGAEQVLRRRVSRGAPGPIPAPAPR